MRAFILAGGLGTRLRSLVNDRPKPLAPVGSAPFLEHQLKFLKANHIRDFVFCVGYRNEQIQEYFQDGSRWEVSITYSVEKEPLGTAGALKLAERHTKDPFLVLNGDTFFELSLGALVLTHQRFRRHHANCLGTLALTQVPDPSEFGSVTLYSDGSVAAFHEKQPGQRPDHFISAGVYVLDPSIFDLIPAGRNVSLEREVFPQILASHLTLCGHCTAGFFVDIGTPQGYHRFQEHAGAIPS